MKIVALIKAFSAPEWLRPCILSIYPYVDKIVITISDISWIGGRGNECREELYGMFDDGTDVDKKIDIIEHNTPDQLNQCDHAYDYIKRKYNPDVVQLIDTDELWDNKNMEMAIEYIKKHPNFDAYRTMMYTYIKSPFFRVDPIEPLRPACFINAKRVDEMGNQPRACNLKNFDTMENVFCHHFVFVRTHFNKVLEKLIQSHVSEKQPYESMDRWIPNVWNKIPAVQNFHPAIGFGHNWKGLKTINKSELPEILIQKDFPLLKQWSLR